MYICMYTAIYIYVDIVRSQRDRREDSWFRFCRCCDSRIKWRHQRCWCIVAQKYLHRCIIHVGTSTRVFAGLTRSPTYSLDNERIIRKVRWYQLVRDDTREDEFSTKFNVELLRIIKTTKFHFFFLYYNISDRITILLLKWLNEFTS